VVDEFTQGVDRVYLDIRDQRRFGGIASRNEQPLVAILSCLGSNRQNPTDVSYRAIQRKLADDQSTFYALWSDLFAGDQNADRDWQVEKWTLFAHGCWREINRQGLAWICQVSVFDGGIHSLTALLDRFIGQSYDCHMRHTLTVIDFDINDDAFETDHRARVNMSQHGLSLSCASWEKG